MVIREILSDSGRCMDGDSELNWDLWRRAFKRFPVVSPKLGRERWPSGVHLKRN
jgi:hypothetical protein